MDRIYLDDNGSSPASLAALEQARASLSLIGNPSSSHAHGRILRALLDEARFFVADSLKARAKDLYFCSGASEANRLFSDALMLRAKEFGSPLKVLMSPFEHPSLLKPIMSWAGEGYFSLSLIKVNENGELYSEESELKAADVFICCQAHNESGLLPKMAPLVAKLRDDALVMSDIAQGFARLAPLGSRVDVMTFSAQKMGGLAGAGGLFLQNNAKSLKAPWPGGGQERGFRPGTEATMLLLALGAAAQNISERRLAYGGLSGLRDRLEARLKAKLALRIIGENHERLPNTSALTFKDRDPDSLRIACDLAGLSVGFGSACSGLAPEGSFALSQMGLSLHEQKTTVRISLTPDANEAMVDEAARRLIELSA